jgi:aspartate aminotransferase
MLQISVPEIKRIEAIAKSSDEYISLSQGALRVGGIPQEVKNHLQQVLNTDITDYYQSAWGIMPLREKLAQKLSKTHSCSLTSKNILITHGCMGAIASLFLTILEKDDEVILPEPTYPAYANIVKVARAKSVFVSSIENNSNPHWNIDIEKIKAATTSRTKIIIFSNPCNPLGTIVPEKNLLELKSWCEQKGIFLIVDESYDDYIFEGTLSSATPMVTESECVIRVGSYSKSLSMSGWRVGFMVVPDHLSISVGTIQDALINCPNVFAQHALLFALDHPEFITKFHEQVEYSKNLSVSLLQPLIEKEILSFYNPPASFYLFLKTNEKDSFDLCMNILNNAKVGLIPGRAFGPSGAPYMRLCFARQPEVLEDGLQRILNFFG